MLGIAPPNVVSLRALRAGAALPITLAIFKPPPNNAPNSPVTSSALVVAGSKVVLSAS